jgi:hypothetical protein
MSKTSLAIWHPLDPALSLPRSCHLYLKASLTMKVTSQVPTEPIAPTRIRPTGASTGRATGEGAKPASSSLPAEETSPAALPSTGLVGTRINTSA